MAGISTFNIQDGFCEALVRGYRSGFLKDSDYAAICGSETLEGAGASAEAAQPCAHTLVPPRTSACSVMHRALPRQRLFLHAHAHFSIACAHAAPLART